MKNIVIVPNELGGSVKLGEQGRKVRYVGMNPRVYRQLRVYNPENKNADGDYFYFERRKENKKTEWYLVPELAFMSLDAPDELIEFYSSDKLTSDLTYWQFISVLYSIYFKNLY